MSRALNKAQLIGNVGNDPDIRTTNGGKKVAHVSLATSRRVQNDERTEWHRLTLWDKLADIAEQYVRKGDRIYAEGRIEYGSYEKNGLTVPTTEIVVHELILLGTPGRFAQYGDAGDDEPSSPAPQPQPRRSTAKRTNRPRATDHYYDPRDDA